MTLFYDVTLKFTLWLLGVVYIVWSQLARLGVALGLNGR